MDRGANAFFNAITLLFVALTVIVAIVVLGVAGGRMEAPILAPENTLVPATQIVLPTLTPSQTPGTSPTPVTTPSAEPGS